MRHYMVSVVGIQQLPTTESQANINIANHFFILKAHTRVDAEKAVEIFFKEKYPNHDINMIEIMEFEIKDGEIVQLSGGSHEAATK